MKEARMDSQTTCLQRLGSAHPQGSRRDAVSRAASVANLARLPGLRELRPEMVVQKRVDLCEIGEEKGGTGCG